MKRLWNGGISAWIIAGTLAVALGGRALAEDSAAVATVNSESITQAQFLVRLQRVHGRDFLIPTNPPSLRGETAGYIVMNSLINERLLLQLAAKNAQLPSDAQVNSELDKVKKQPNVIQALAQHTVTEDELKYNIRLQFAQFQVATDGVKATDAEVEDYYKRHIADYTTPERWSIAAIRTRSLNEVSKIQSELDLKSHTFAQIAQMYSDDENSKNKGGNLGSVEANNPELPVIVRDAIKKLKVGEVTPMLSIGLINPETGGKVPSYWFVRLLGIEPEAVQPLQNVRAQAEKLATLEKTHGIAVADKKVADLRSKSDIKINIPGYESLLTPTKKS